MMKIFAVSDLHGNLDGLDPAGADLVVIAGDVAPMKGWGAWHINDQVKWMNRKFADWCAKYPTVDFVVIPGNHDLFAQRLDTLHTKMVLPSNVHFLIDEVVEVKGLRLAGSPWIPAISGRWAFEACDEDDLARHFAWIPEGVDILITHSPPFVEGWNVDVSLQTQSPHFGSRAVTAALRRVKPRLAFCGHIHTGDHRVHDLVHDDGSMTKIYNISRLNEDYCVAYEPRVVEFSRKEDLVELTVEIEDDLAHRARERFRQYGLTVEQALLIFLEELVKAEGDMSKSAENAIERIDRASASTRNSR